MAATGARSALRTATAAALSSLVALGGCTSVSRSFPGRQPAHVWMALKAVAETPDYGDPDPARRWFVRSNDVWVDEPNARIEIRREVERVLHRASARPLHERREWKFQVRLDPGDVPSATFVSRGWGVPMHAAAEADRYFEDVWSLLRTDATLQGPAAPAPHPAPPPVEPAVDVDALEPD